MVISFFMVSYNRNHSNVVQLIAVRDLEKDTWLYAGNTLSIGLLLSGKYMVEAGSAKVFRPTSCEKLSPRTPCCHADHKGSCQSPHQSLGHD